MNLVCSLLGIAFLAQAHPESDVVVEKMKALSFLEGQWEGQGWMQGGPGSRTLAKVTETVVFKLSGRALLIEGLGRSTGNGSEKNVHEAIALITWDAKQNRYAMLAMTARAGRVEPDLQVSDKSIVWSFATPMGKVRYTIKINEKGEWFEIGEFAREGAEWSKFFEMTLIRKSP